MAWNKKRYRRALERQIRAWSAAYQNRARIAAECVLENLEKGMTTREAVQAALEASELDTHVRESLSNSLVQALADGYGVLPRVVDVPAVRWTFLHTAWAADKMTLSTRLHGSSMETRRLVVGAIRDALKRGSTCVSMARSLYDGYSYGGVIKKAELPKYLSQLESAARHMMTQVPEDWSAYRGLLARAKRSVSGLARDGAPTQAQKTAYLKLVEAAEGSSRRALDRAVHVALEERSRYHAERIARTEMARAWSEGFHARNDDDPDVVGYKWSLGTRHPHYDICDFHATVNLYGMGPGVYPKDRCPELPAHPHCLCRLVEVFRDEAKRGVFMPSNGQKFFEALPGDKRRALLSVAGSEAFARGDDWRKHLKGYAPGAAFKNRFDIQFFAFNPEEERQKILNGYYSLNVSPQKQARHIEGSMEYERYCEALEATDHRGRQGRKPSILYGGLERAQEIIDKYAGTGRIEVLKDGHTVIENLCFSDHVGLAWSRDEMIYKPAYWVKIVYAKKSGTHLYPTFPPEKKEGEKNV